MTKINKISMKGFKSFGQKTDLIFGESFNCVLGPNGSGKSNIMDAICFVLGKGSAKGLRVERAANLIYNGGKKKSPAKEGEVTIYFDNAKNTFPTEEQEVKITRVIKATGNSVYKINDKTRTRQEILDLLSHANIEPDGYSIILQGDITRLVEMSPNDRRAIIDEIAGIGIYEEKKQKAINELNKVDEKLNEADIILKEREAYLKDLKKERDQALKYKELDEKIARNRATFLNMNIKEKEGALEKVKKQLEEVNEKVAKHQKSIDGYRKTVDTARNEIQGITKEIEEKGEKEQVTLLKRIEDLKVTIATDKNKIDTLTKEIDRINERKTQLQASFDDLNSKVKELTDKKETHEKRKSKISSEIQFINEKVDKFKQKHKLEGAEDIDKELEEIDKQAEAKEKEIQELRVQQQELLRDKDRLEFQLETIDEKIAKVLEVKKEHKTELDTLQRRKKEFKETTVQLNKLLNEDSSLAIQLSNARQKLFAAKESFSKLSARNISIQETAAADIATKKILENKNKFGNVYGTISSLGNVQSKYSLALEIAAGNKLKSIVVDNDKTASNCIKYLKQNRLGTATFIPLNKIKAPAIRSEAKALLKTNGVHGLAMDLVEYDSKFKTAFGYVFGNTLVVDTIDVARRIGIGKAKMVTLDGDMSELSGVMHGGFRSKRKGIGFKEKEVVAELSKVEKDIANSEGLIATLEKRKNDNEKTIITLREKKASSEGEIIKIEKSLHLDEGDMGADKKVKDETEKKVKDMEKQLVTLSGKVSQGNQELAQVKIKKQKLRDKISQLRNPVLVAELNTFEQKKGELKEELIRVEGDIKNIAMQEQNIIGPEKENIAKILRQHKKEQEDVEKEISATKKKISEQEKDLKQYEQEHKKYYSKFKELFDRREKLNQEIQKTEAKIIIEEERIRGFDKRITQVSVDKARYETELTGLYEEFKKYEGVELFKSKAKEDLKKEIHQFELMVAQLGNVNMKALEVYDQIEQEYQKLLEKRETLLGEKEEVLMMMNEIETKKKDMFLQAFEVINKNFVEVFTRLVPKGQASLVLDNPEDPLAEGMTIKVRLLGKKFLDIRSLSGGEKSLTALAFLFAIQEHEPASFYVLDEVDAALDKSNTEKLAKLIKLYSKRAQYIMISHNDGVITEATTLYGVSMDENGLSKVISLKV